MSVWSSPSDDEIINFCIHSVIFHLIRLQIREELWVHSKHSTNFINIYIHNGFTKRWMNISVRWFLEVKKTNFHAPTFDFFNCKYVKTQSTVICMRISHNSVHYIGTAWWIILISSCLQVGGGIFFNALPLPLFFSLRGIVPWLKGMFKFLHHRFVVNFNDAIRKLCFSSRYHVLIRV